MCNSKNPLCLIEFGILIDKLELMKKYFGPETIKHWQTVIKKAHIDTKFLTEVCHFCPKF